MSIISSAQQSRYRTDGYLLMKNLFNDSEIGALKAKARSDQQLDQHAYDREDGEGGQIRLSLWNQPGSGIYGAFARSNRMFQITGTLLGDEPYHYHSKMIMKDARTGGAWAWHQDYGYWYQNAVLKPDLISAFIAIDPATPENGCLQIIPGSHHYGRIDHVLTGSQAGADLERVHEIREREGLLFIEMSPGDVVFFHPNLLHRSDQNNSQNSRWSMICCYNSRSNSPFKESRHPAYSPIEVIEDDQVIAFASRIPSQMSWHEGQTPTADTLGEQDG